MSLVGGLFGSFVTLVVTAAVVQPATTNLSPLTRAVVLVCLLGLALVLGLMAGSTVGRRSRTERTHLRLFSAFAGAVCGGLLGGAILLGLTAAYLRDYAVWPSGTVETVLTIAGVPILGALGFFIGALAGFGVGGLSGLVLAVVVPRR
ncbi:MAG TPA: hypothetical protein VF221_03710 [Chloroflexota bacterium]